MQKEIREQGRVRNRITRFRKRSGEILETFYSADLVVLDGLQCSLAVSADLPERAQFEAPPARRSSAHST
jgi:hypothetical protein